MRLRELNESISQLVTVNRQLNPKIWNGDELDLEVSAKLEQIAEAFVKFIGIELAVTDYTITGSNANYTWTEHSDLDLHIIVKGTVTDAERELYNSKKALWAEQHTITVKGLPVECYVQGEQEEHHSTGVFSIAKDRWLVEPKKIKPEVDDSAVERKKDSIIHDIETALLSRDLERMRRVKERVTEMRKAGLERAGEWSVENLVFKILRNLGLIDQITEKIRELEDAELSLEQQTNLLD